MVFDYSWLGRKLKVLLEAVDAIWDAFWDYMKQDIVSACFLMIFLSGLIINTFFMAEYKVSIADVMLGYGAFKGSDLAKYGMRSKWNTAPNEDPDHVDRGKQGGNA